MIIFLLIPLGHLGFELTQEKKISNLWGAICVKFLVKLKESHWAFIYYSTVRKDGYFNWWFFEFTINNKNLKNSYLEFPYLTVSVSCSSIAIVCVAEPS